MSLATLQAYLLVTSAVKAATSTALTLGPSSGLSLAPIPSNPAGKKPSKPRKESIMMAFETMDTHNRGQLSQIDVIKGLRTNERVRELLDLPSKIRQEDGSRDQFELVFHEMDFKNDKTVDLEHFMKYTAKLAGVEYGLDDTGLDAGVGSAIEEGGGELRIENGLLEIENGKFLELDNRSA